MEGWSIKKGYIKGSVKGVVYGQGYKGTVKRGGL